MFGISCGDPNRIQECPHTSYASFYHVQNFRGAPTNQGSMDYYDWIADKRSKASLTTCMSVNIDDVRFDNWSEDQVIVKFDQTYRSNRYCDIGIKTLRFERDGGAWKIVSEQQPSTRACTPGCG